MTYRINISKVARKFIEKQDSKQKLRLYKAIYRLPSGTDVKKLAGTSGLYRLRVGDYRVIYTVDEEIRLVYVDNVNNRGQVYKEL